MAFHLPLSCAMFFTSPQAMPTFLRSNVSPLHLVFLNLRVFVFLAGSTLELTSCNWSSLFSAYDLSSSICMLFRCLLPLVVWISSIGLRCRWYLAILFPRCFSDVYFHWLFGSFHRSALQMVFGHFISKMFLRHLFTKYLD